jgi:hypothetical protein
MAIHRVALCGYGSTYYDTVTFYQGHMLIKRHHLNHALERWTDVCLTPDDRLHCEATTVCHAREISVRHLNRVLKSLSRQSMWWLTDIGKH